MRVIPCGACSGAGCDHCGGAGAVSLEAVERPRKLRIFVSGPLGAPEFWDRNVRRACCHADHILEGLGRVAVPFVPHLAAMWARSTSVGADRTWGEWLDWCEAWIDACDAVYRTPGESPGADREVEYAKRNGIPVFFGFPQLAEWIDANKKSD